jgi:putative peptidoglycan lipid II flippase
MGYGVHHAILFVDRAMATTLGAGSVATLHFGYRLSLVAGQLSGLAVSTVVFPRMAEQAAQNDYTALRASLSQALKVVWTIGLPLVAGLILFREPLVKTLLERGAFDLTAANAVSEVIRWYGVAVLADALCQPLWRLVYAWRQTGIVVAVNAIQTVLRILGNVALMPSLGYNGLALSAALGLVAQLLVLAWLARRRLGQLFDGGWWARALALAGAAAVAMSVASLVSWLSNDAPTWINLMISGFAGGTVYLGLWWLLEKQDRETR